LKLSKFILPPKGSLTETGPSDPLLYYYKPLIGKLYISRINTVLSMLPDKSYERVLEIGYGSGLLIPFLKQQAKKYYGVDIDSSPTLVLQNLSKLGYDKDIILEQDDFTKITLEKFDLIVAVSVFEHIKDLKALITTLKKSLTKEGYLIVGMPRVDRFMDCLFQIIGFSDIKNHHCTTYLEFLNATKDFFEIVQESNMPSFAPKSFSLYHGVLLKLKDEL